MESKAERQGKGERMTTAVLDRLKAARQLENAGIETRPAEAIIHTMAEVFDDTVVTRTGITTVKNDVAKVKVFIAALETKR